VAAFGTSDPFFSHRFVKPVQSDASMMTPSVLAMALVISGIVGMVLKFCWEANLTSWLEKQTSNNRMNYENR